MPQVSVIIPTLNRASALRVLLRSVVGQDARVAFEIIVADNGSTDATLAVVQEIGATGVLVRYVRDARPGVSYARNAGAALATAPILAFTDDDQEVAPSWLAVIVGVFEEHPDVDAIGGRVLARWPRPRPDWLTSELLGPVSLFDRGNERLRLHRRQWMCLPGGNLACRRDVFMALGGFSPHYPRSQDRELTVRLLLSGREAMYVPEMVVYHHLDAERLTKARFRAWSLSEGYHRAGYAFEELFTPAGEIRALPPDSPRVFGVSRFMYRRLAEAAWQYAGCTIRARRVDAFRHETRLRYLWAYIRRRQALEAAFAPLPTLRRAGRIASTAVSRVLALLAEFLG